MFSRHLFQELVQNADDAGARTVKILVDDNSYGTDSLVFEGLAGMQVRWKHPTGESSKTHVY